MRTTRDTGPFPIRLCFTGYELILEVGESIHVLNSDDQIGDHRSLLISAETVVDLIDGRRREPGLGVPARVSDGKQTLSLVPPVAALRGAGSLPGATFDVEVEFPSLLPLVPSTVLSVVDGFAVEGADRNKADLCLRLPFPNGVRWLLGRIPFRDIASDTEVAGDVLMLGCVSGWCYLGSGRTTDNDRYLRHLDWASSALAAFFRCVSSEPARFRALLG